MNINIPLVASCISAVVALTTFILNVQKLREMFKGSGSKNIYEKKAIGNLRFNSYLVKDEIYYLVLTGLLLNYIGIMFTGNIKGILFFDMLGTAFTAFFLGPWWGAIVGLLSNAVFNLFTYPELANQDAIKIIFSWTPVNIIGGIYWGYLSRKAFFKEYLQFKNVSLIDHLNFLFVFGVLASFIMNIPGAFIPEATNDHNFFNQKNIARQLLQFTGNTQSLPVKLRIYLFNWLYLSVTSLPDKIVSVAFAVSFIKIGFPIHERQVIYGGVNKVKIVNGYLPIATFILFYLPVYYIYISDGRFNHGSFWPLWSIPLALALVAFAAHWIFLFQPKDISVNIDQRRNIYKKMHLLIQHNKIAENRNIFLISIVVAIVIFILSIPVFNVTVYSKIGFTFIIVIGAITAGFQIFSLCLAQNSLRLSTQETLQKIEEETIEKVLLKKIKSNEDDIFSEISLIPGLEIVANGRTKHLYKFNEHYLLIASDRIKAYKTVLSATISNKGELLTELSRYWFSKFASQISNHVLPEPEGFYDRHPEFLKLRKRIQFVRYLDIIPYQFVVRRYLIGTIWNKYNESREAGYLNIPPGLSFGDRLDKLVITPIKKDTDIYVDTSKVIEEIERRSWNYIQKSISDIFTEAEKVCVDKGITLLDTMFEFGYSKDGSISQIFLANELLTPDVSRFTFIETRSKDTSLETYKDFPWDRQLIENYLKKIGWNQIDQPPTIPNEIILETKKRYEKIYERLTGKKPS
ncbi:MAG: phosphoribosylaminoimidazolesuccinocarboxamide synthase [Bacteroidetes bacterium]|nr:phosphoribosylaminoimidazolesuccinocarboxamide synthase [Bacteroidota bacterium]